MRKPNEGRRARRGFSPEFKAGAVRLVLDEGKTIGAAARELDLTPSALGNWVRQARADRSKGKTGLTTEERAELAKLRKEVRELRMERDILKSRRLLRQAPGLKIVWIEAERAEKGIAVAYPSQRPWGRWVLGMALYRNGRYQEAIRALEGATGGVVDPARLGFFLAMARHRIGRTKEARADHDRAVAWTDEHAPDDPQRRRYTEEAARVLGITR